MFNVPHSRKSIEKRLNQNYQKIIIIDLDGGGGIKIKIHH
jgi:hypothetical protein